MVLLPAAMFAMFFFLSLFIQNVMGYSPLKAGVAFLPFSVGIVISAGDRVQPGQPDRPPLHRRRRHPDGRGGAVRVLPARGPDSDTDVLTPCTGQPLGAGVSYWTRPARSSA